MPALGPDGRDKRQVVSPEPLAFILSIPSSLLSTRHQLKLNCPNMIFLHFLLFALFSASCQTSPAPNHQNNARVIATPDDIPDLPEGFSWTIKKCPIGDDTRVSSNSHPVLGIVLETTDF